MVPAHRQYTQELHDAFGGYWATWLPVVSLDLGTVGTVEDRIFIPRSHLRSFGINFGVEADSSRDKFQYASAGAVSMNFKAQGQANNAFQHVGDAHAGASISFSRQNSVVFSLLGCREDRIADQHQLATALLDLPRGWPEDYAVITHIVRAESGTILISGSEQSQIEISAQADIGGLEGLARLDVGLSVAFMKDMQTEYVASSSLTPLFRAVRVKKDIVQRRSVRSLGPITIMDVADVIDLQGEP